MLGLNLHFCSPIIDIPLNAGLDVAIRPHFIAKHDINRTIYTTERITSLQLLFILKQRCIFVKNNGLLYVSLLNYRSGFDTANQTTSSPQS